MDKISVALCTFNGSTFIHEQINSILNQTLPINEIIVCDDGSTDDTMTILKQYEIEYPGLFKIFKNEINLKSVKNFEKAITLCTGEFIFLADQDDVWIKDKVKKYIEYFKENQNINVLASNGYCIDEDNINHEKYSLWDVPLFLRENNIEVNYLKIISFRQNIATGATMAFRRDFKSKFLPFPILNEYHHDEWIALIASKYDSFELLQEKHFKYRIHSNQQVGGVFFDKTALVKKQLIEIFDLRELNQIDLISLTSCKKRIKKIISCLKKNQLLSKINSQHKDLFNKNIEELTKQYYNERKNTLILFPIRAHLLFLVDKIIKKRQLK
jgi:glycosyltransferase involved in cell wall biosynthesis